MNDYKDSQESRVERLNSMIRENRITRHNWLTVDEQGREVACLLAALSPEAGEAESPAACPASVMPEWFAHLTPWIDDHSSATAWPQVIRRYAACAAKWSALDDAAWRRVEVAARRASVVEAISHTTEEQVLAACRGVLAWLDAGMPESSHAAVKAAMEARAAATGAVEARAAATGAAVAAATAAAEAWRSWAASTESAAKGEEWRAWAASTAEVTHWARAAARAESAESSAEAAMAAMRAAPWAAEAAAGAAAGAANEAEYEASDRIIDAVLSYLEKECGL